MPKASSQTSIWIHCLTLMIVLISFMDVFDKETHAEDVGTYCSESFRDGQISNITCKVNSTSISNAGCFVGLSKVLFTFSSASGSPSTLCSVDYSPPPTSCAPNSTVEVCFCAERNADVIIYQYNFKGDASYNGGNFVCDICSRSSKPVIREISPNCTNITIEITTTAATTQSAAVTTTVTKSTSEENSTQDNSTCHDAIICETWKIVVIVVLPILFIIAVIIGVLGLKWKKLLFFENKTVDPTRSSNEHHQNDLRSGRQNASFVSGPPKNGALPKSENPDASSALAPPDQSSLKKSKTTNSEKTGSHHVASEKSPPKEHSTRKETALDLTELNSGSATSEESASNIVTHRQLRPLPTPNLTSVERNSSVDPFRQTNPLPEISGRLKQ